MKKTIFAIAFCVVALVAISCGGGNTPRAVAEKATKCMIDGDFEKCADYVYFKSAEQKERFMGMLQFAQSLGKSDVNLPEKVEFIEENVDEENGTAEETFEYTMKDGKTKRNTVRMIKVDGKWFVRQDNR